MSVIVGLDVGYGNTKVVWGARHAEVPQTVVMPSGSAPLWALPALPNGNPDLCGGVPVLVDGEKWVAGVESHRLENYAREHSEDFTTTKSWTALVHAALATVKSPRIDVLVAGLPVAEFFRGDARVKLKARLEGVHHVRAGEVVEVMRAVIVPQPIGAFADNLRTRLLARAPEQAVDHMTLVVDPGHYSADWVIFQSGSVKKQSSSSSSQAGRQVLEATSKLLFEQMGLRVESDRLEAAVRRGDATIRVGQSDVAIRPYLEQAGGQVVEQVMRDVAGKIGQQKFAINTVIVTGGGASLFRSKIATALSHAEIVVPQDPILSNARGFWATGLGVKQ